MSMVKAGRELFLTAILATFIFLAPSATHVFAVEYAVGVTVGDYVMYTVSVSWVPEWNVTGPEPFSVTYYRLIQWMKVEVQNVSGTEVKIVTTTHYTDEETRVASIIDVKEGPRKGQFYLALIAANLKKGDSVTFHSDAPVLNDTVTRRCAGASRRVNILDITQTFNDCTYSTVGDPILETYRNIVYWDQATGIMLETYQKEPQTQCIVPGWKYILIGYMYVTWKATDTNLWTPESRPWFEENVGYLIGILVPAGALVAGLILLKRRRLQL